MQHHCKNLTTLSKHTRGWAGVLLLVYLFITAPVSLWHNCSQEERYSVSHSGKTDVHKSFSVVCKICDHHYDTYLDGAVAEIPFVNAVFAKIFNHPAADQLLSNPFSLWSNKSPPAFL